MFGGYWLRLIFNFLFLFISKIHHRITTGKTPPPQSVWKLPTPEERVVTSRDGIKIHYVVIPGNSSKTIVMAAGLGVRSPFRVCAPLIYQYGESYTYIAWHYRGLFTSEEPKSLRQLAIYEHAKDLMQILKAEGKTSVQSIIGHSMGVQVALEFCVRYPECVQSLILLNGTHGQVFNSAFQPFIRIPFARTIITQLVTYLQNNWKLTELFAILYKRFLSFPVRLYSFLFGSKLLKQLFGLRYLDEFFIDYLSIIGDNRQHTINYLRLFQALDGHSVYHLLPYIEQPVLIVSGLLDVLTPAYQSYEMQSRIPHSKHLVCPFASHASMLEAPERVLPECAKFLDNLENQEEEYKLKEL